MKTSKLRQWAVWGAAVAVVLAGMASSVAAQSSSPPYIQEIRVSGNKHVSIEKIKRVVRLSQGSSFSAADISDAVKRLFATRQFSNLEAYREPGSTADSVVVVLIVEEYPRIDKVDFLGNDNINDDDLTSEISLARGSFVRPAVVGSDEDKITKLYREKGYYRVTVTDSIGTDPKTRDSVLFYVINEGEKVSVQHIDFIGNRVLESEDILKVMKTKEDRWWRGGDFKPNEFEEDKQRIVQLYKSRGFLDVELLDHELVFSDNGKDLDVFLTLVEGRQYHVGEVTWSGDDLFPDSTIAQQITLKKGEPFNETELTNIQFQVANLYGDKGYIYANVSPLKDINKDVVDVELGITRGRLARVNEINIVGNTKTAEYVIRRQLVLHPGDIFLSGRLRRSLREVFNLGYFAGPPAPSVVPANEDGDIDVTLRVEEKPAGQFRMGAGFSQLNKISGFVGVTEPNFLGRGLRTGFDWEFSRYRQNINVQFTQPWLMGTPTELSLNVYSQIQNQVQQQFFADRRTGFSVGVGRPFPWLDYTRIYTRYSLESVELSDFSELYKGPLLDTDWPQTTSAITVSLLRNSTDNPFHPTTGTRSLLSAKWTGGVLGGDVGFQRYESSLSWYYPLFWKFVLEVRNDTGVLDSFAGASSGVPDYELFRLGGNRRYALRGYDFYDVVPDGNARFVGGRFMNILSHEVSYPIAPPTVYGLFFFDAGNTWNSFQDASLFTLKKGAGLGIRIELPMLGTVGMDYGYGYDRPGGGGWEPHITFGGGF